MMNPGRERLDPPYDNYLAPEAFDAELENLAREREGIVSLEMIGQSAGGREIPLVRITGSHDFRLPAVLVVSMIHGDEWITAEAGLRFVKRVLEGAERGKRRLKKVLNARRLLWLPVMNPDGRAKTYNRLGSGKRAWGRTNDSGVDLNRNFPVGFDSPSLVPLADSLLPFGPFFKGIAAFSEPETRAVKAMVMEREPISAAVILRSPGNVICYPYGHKLLPPERAMRLWAIAARMARRTRKPMYSMAQASHRLLMGGSMRDWLWDHRRVPAFSLFMGAPRLQWRHPAELLNPFWYLNPPGIAEVADNIIPALISLCEEPIFEQKPWF